MARPTVYSEDLAENLCQRIVGPPARSLRLACQAPKMPTPSTVYRWAAARAAFGERLARAYEARGQGLLDEAHDLVMELEARCRAADRALGKGKVVECPGRQTVRATLAAADLKIRLAEKLAPKKYGALLRLGGEDGVALPLVLLKHQQKDGQAADA